LETVREDEAGTADLGPLCASLEKENKTLTAVAAIRQCTAKSYNTGKLWQKAQLALHT